MWSRPQLEVRDLELVLALAHAGSTAAAASALHITQSAVSRALAQAEDRLGVRLFERGASGVSATPAGQRLIAGAGLLLSQLSELERTVAVPSPTPTRIRLVCECYTAYRWLPSALTEVHRHLPSLELEIAAEHTHEPLAALLRDRVDVALLTTARVPSAQGARNALIEQSLLSDEVVFLVAASHALAHTKSLSREHLRSYPMISSNAPAAEQRWFASAVFGRKPPKLQMLRFPLTEAIVDAARAGMGIAVLSEWMASGYLGTGELLVKRLTTGPLRRPWRIAYRRELAAIVEPLVGALANSAPRLGFSPGLRAASG